MGKLWTKITSTGLLIAGIGGIVGAAGEPVVGTALAGAGLLVAGIVGFAVELAEA